MMMTALTTLPLPGRTRLKLPYSFNRSAPKLRSQTNKKAQQEFQRRPLLAYTRKDVCRKQYSQYINGSRPCSRKRGIERDTAAVLAFLLVLRGRQVSAN
jgi:hypothetical protein